LEEELSSRLIKTTIRAPYFYHHQAFENRHPFGVFTLHESYSLEELISSVKLKVHFFIWYQSHVLESILAKFVVCWIYYFTHYWVAIGPLINI